MQRNAFKKNFYFNTFEFTSRSYYLLASEQYPCKAAVQPLLIWRSCIKFDMQTVHIPLFLYMSSWAWYCNSNVSCLWFGCRIEPIDSGQTEYGTSVWACIRGDTNEVLKTISLFSLASLCCSLVICKSYLVCSQSIPQCVFMLVRGLTWWMDGPKEMCDLAWVASVLFADECS